MSKYTISNFGMELENVLRQYIEAQYHVKDEGLVKQRRNLLLKEKTISSSTFIETNKVYSKSVGYDSLAVEKDLKDMLGYLSEFVGETGFVPTPFSHQIKALDDFLAKNKNLIIATGTGSGKTESFLYPLICQLIRMSKNKSSEGVTKSLILYPMNALVSDQTTRLRKLMGSKRSKSEFNKLIGRPLTFANYTSATPSSGDFNAKRNKQISKSLRKLYSLDSSSNESISYRNKLESALRLPKKSDLESFISDLDGASDVNNLKNSDDSELILRAEVQNNSPDLLVTNFSMLEYMLLRPIEQSIFDKTKEWLKEDERNQFTIILDEAHIYNGVSGSEVSLLIRRLKARLGASNEQFRIILASASLGSDDSTILDVANKLTGRDPETFSVIHHDLKVFIDEIELNQEMSSLIESINAADIASYSSTSEEFKIKLEDKLHSLMELRDKSSKDLTCEELAYEALSGLSLINSLRNELEEPKSIEEIKDFLKGQLSAKNINYSNLDNYFETIINLGSFATKELGFSSEVLLPIRAHFMYRGLPGIYTCINPDCGSSEHPLGLMYSDKRTICKCGSKVYEMFTHRECGTAYIKGYWSKTTDLEQIEGVVVHNDGGEHHKSLLEPVYLCVDQHSYEGCNKFRLNPRTGQLSMTGNFGVSIGISSNLEDFGKKLIENFNGTEEAWFHEECQGCGLGTLSSHVKKSSDKVRGALDIKPLGTIGDEPFTYLVREQFKLQPASYKNVVESDVDENLGRKSLIFSDGRQKAARIAKNIPETIQRDVFRSYFVWAYQWLQSDEASDKLAEDFDEYRVQKTIDPVIVYYGFLEICTKTKKKFFEGKDRERFESHVEQYQCGYPINKESIPESYYVYYASILCKPRYNLTELAIAGVRPKISNRAIREAEKLGVSRSLLKAFFAKRIRDFLTAGAVSKVSKQVIYNAFNYSPSNVTKPEFRLSARAGNLKSSKQNKAENISDKYKQLNEMFIQQMVYQELTDTESTYKLNLEKVYIELAVNSEWYECQSCLFLSDLILPDGRCSACGAEHDQVKKFDDESEYFRARKLFWRNPIRKALEKIDSEIFIEVGEHSAQLNYRDNEEKIVSTVVENELKFQNILDPRNGVKGRPIDILSSTTTMEVGIDIGGLIAVAMRNVPPQRQNYQQRAGRAGRRGSSFSSVVTYCQNGSHDSHYFKHPSKIIAGPMAPILLDPCNKNLAKRHLLSAIIGSYFHHVISKNESKQKNADIFSHLGSLEGFLEKSEPNIFGLKTWLTNIELEDFQEMTSWYADLFGELDTSEILENLESLEEILTSYFADLKVKQEQYGESLDRYLLDILFDTAQLPSYAFPTDLVQFEIYKNENNNLVPVEKPTFSMSQAIQELAPGRALVVNKNMYQVGSILSESIFKRGVNKAQGLFRDENIKRYSICEICKTLLLDSDITCCSKQKLRDIKVIKPRFVVRKYSRNSVRPSDVVYTSPLETKIVHKGRTSKVTCDRFLANHEVYTSEGVRLARINEGVPQEHGKGFLICEDCGAVSPPHEANSDKSKHQMDYDTSEKDKKSYERRFCRGSFRQVSIGYDFETTMSSIRVELDSRFNLPDGVLMPPALHSASISLSLAIRNAFARFEDIEQNDLGFGSRIIPDEDKVWLELYFYDDMSGGAGYAAQVHSYLYKLFLDAERDLKECSCDSRCYECLSSYSTRFIDNQLNRHLAMSLLNYIKNDELTLDGDPQLISMLFKGLSKELEGLGISLEGNELIKGTKRKKILLEPSLSVMDHSTDNIILSPFELLFDMLPSVEKVERCFQSD